MKIHLQCIGPLFRVKWCESDSCTFTLFHPFYTTKVLCNVGHALNSLMLTQSYITSIYFGLRWSSCCTRLDQQRLGLIPDGSEDQVQKSHQVQCHNTTGQGKGHNWYGLYFVSHDFLAVPRQLNRWQCHWVTAIVGALLKLNSMAEKSVRDHSHRLGLKETFDLNE